MLANMRGNEALFADSHHRLVICDVMPTNVFLHAHLLPPKTSLPHSKHLVRAEGDSENPMRIHPYVVREYPRRNSNT